MIEAQYHDRREADERAVASFLPEGKARESHLELADRHADKAWLIRNGYSDGVVDPSVKRPASRGGADYYVDQAVRRSRERVALSRRILAESRENVPPRE